MGSLRFLPLRVSLTVALVGALSGCVAGYQAYSASGGGNEAANGEQHDTPYPAKDTLHMTEDVLRGEGILFEIQPDDKLETQWHPGDKGPGLFGSAIGVNPQYRYIIEVVPTGTRTSRIVANVETQDIPDAHVNNYLPSKRLNLFSKFDQVAAQFPPPSPTPRAGGVNFALLPGENLRALALRATGSESNWKVIAKDNGLTSSSDLSGIQSIWISDRLLPHEKENSSAAP